MRRLKLTLIMTILCFTQINAQRGNILPSNTTAGGAEVASKEIWQAFSNPASAALHNNYIIEAAYENRYITQELSNKSIAALFPTKHLNITTSFNHFGYSVYNEMLLGVGLARNFGSWRLGIEVDAFMIYVSPTEKYSYTITAQAGAQIDITDNFTLAFSVFNPTFSTVKTQRAIDLPVRFTIGTNYQIHKTINWLVQIDADIRNRVYWRSGFTYCPFKEFNVKIGAYGSNYIIPTIGMGLNLKPCIFNLRCDIDPRIGVTLMGALRFNIFRLNKRN